MNAAATELFPSNDQPCSRPLSVLYVDDEPVLLNVCKQYLERRSDIEVTTAESVEQALILLENSCFDVIISDYQMPETDGIGFLKILQQRKSSVPFILFTGRGREEVVIEAINNGATYYIQKGGDPKSQFAELDHKIREASRRRHAEDALYRSELYYRTLFENSGTAVVILDEDMTIREANAEFAEISGYPRETLAGNVRITDLVSDGEGQKIRNYCRLLCHGPGVGVCALEIAISPPDRQVRYMNVVISAIPATGQYIASLADHTRLRLLEEEHRRISAKRERMSGDGPTAFQRDPLEGIPGKPAG